MSDTPSSLVFSFARPIRYRKTGWFRKALGFGTSQIERRLASEYAPLVIGQFRRLPKPSNPPRLWDDIECTIAEISAKLKTAAPGDEDAGVSWECIQQIEYAIVSFEPLPDLVEHAAILQQEYLELASPAEREAVLARHPEGKLPKEEGPLRAAALQLLQEVHWRYVGLAAFNDTADQVLRNVVVGSAVGLVLMLVPAALLRCMGFNGGLIWLLAAAGQIGGLVSTVQRLQSARFVSNFDLDAASLGQGKFSINLSPYLGGIFALMFGCIAASGLIEISTAGKSLLPELRFDAFLGPVDHRLIKTEVAKLLVWGFAAGFAERLVPDRLSSLINSAKN